jgi:hypothetical protein
MNDATKFYLEAAGRLTPDEQFDVAVAIAANLGYRLVEAASGEDSEPDGTPDSVTYAINNLWGELSDLKHDVHILKRDVQILKRQTTANGSRS